MAIYSFRLPDIGEGIAEAEVVAWHVAVGDMVEEDAPLVPSAVGLWPIANWFEREVWDMFGIRFENHPDLRRLLMYEEFVGHPLRKDYPVNRRQPLVGPKT